MRSVFIKILNSMFCIIILFQHINSTEQINTTYIMGYNFRDLCKHFFASPNPNSKIKVSLYSDPKKVKKGDFIYIRNDDIVHFFKHIHPKITNPYVLISHQSDSCSPSGLIGFGQGVYADQNRIKQSLEYLNDKKIIAWFGSNPDIVHPKFIPLPIGIRNWHDEKFIITINKAIEENKKQLPVKINLLYMNFTIKNAPEHRQEVYNIFINQNFCKSNRITRQAPVDENYLANIAESKFVLSPHGNGMDCFRTWEILFMGSFPVVKTSYLDSLYEDLPVLIVNNWSEVTENFLNNKYIEMCSKKYKYEKLYMPYWKNKIIDTVKQLMFAPV